MLVQKIDKNFFVRIYKANRVDLFWCLEAIGDNRQYVKWMEKSIFIFYCNGFEFRKEMDY